MLYLHESTPPIIHRNLKSPNLLVDEAGRVKVSSLYLRQSIDPGKSASRPQEAVCAICVRLGGGGGGRLQGIMLLLLFLVRW
jgi:hypothetical protein